MGWKYKSSAQSVKNAIVSATAKGTRGTAKEILKGGKRRAPKLSGALRASGYVNDAAVGLRLGARNGYSSAIAAAIALNPQIAADLEPEVVPLGSADGIVASVVAFAANYADAIEYGAYSSNGYRAPRPFLAPSGFEQERELARRVGDELRKVELSKKL